MVRERNVERRLGGRGLAVVALLAAVALPLGAKVAAGDERGAAQAGVAASAGSDVAVAQSNVLAAAERPEDVGAGLPTSAGRQPAATDRAAAGPAFAQVFGQSSFDRSAQPQDTVAGLEAELAAARQNVERLQKQLETARGTVQGHRGRSREARLGQIIFKYQDAGSGGSVLAFDGPTKKLLWTLDVPLNADSGIRCYDDETLLIRSADGYTRLVGAWDGKVIRIWAPGVEAPNVANAHQINPFGTSAAAGPAQKPGSGTPAASPRKSEDPEQRMERMEESIRRLTDAVDRLSRERKE